MMSTRPRAVLFDAGGTLVLQHPAEMAAKLGIPIDPEEAYQAHYRTMAEFSARREAGDQSTWAWFLERYFGRLGHPEPAGAGRLIDDGYLLWTWPLPGVVAAIADVVSSGVRVAVVSNSDGSVERSLQRAGMGDLFEFVVDSALAGASKPDPAIFLMACERLSVEPEECWYVGDSPFHDVSGALGAGFSRAWLVDPLHLHGHQDRLTGVADLPRRLGGR